MFSLFNGARGKDKEAYIIPSSVQQTIPIRRIWPDGIFLSGNKHTKCFRFSDINYALSADNDKNATLDDYGAVVNSLESGCNAKITVINRRCYLSDIKDNLLLDYEGDGLDRYRDEYNDILINKATGSSSIVRERILTLSVMKQDIDAARVYFNRIGAELTAKFKRLGSRCTELDANARLRLLHEFYRKGEEDFYSFNINEAARRGHDFRDYICPDRFSFKINHFEMGSRFGRVMFIKDFANRIGDDFFAELSGLGANMMLTIDIIPVSTEDAIKEAEKRLLGVETNIANWQRKQNQNNNFSAAIPYDMDLQRAEARAFIDDIVAHDQRMFLCTILIMHTADTLEQLDIDSDAIKGAARQRLCQIAALNTQQLDGMNATLPIGASKLEARRTLNTESLTIFAPFCAQEISMRGGVYYGTNTVSNNLIIADRKQLQNGNSMIFGVSGSGKSVMAKQEIIKLTLSTNDDIIIIDPEREYPKLVGALGGEVINISSTSPNHINAMDINASYGDSKNPLILKTEFLLTLCAQFMNHPPTEGQRSIIDRCAGIVYHPYIQSRYTTDPPTLLDFHEELLRFKEPEAADLALAIEIFAKGSLSTFAKRTNCDVHNRLICYDILDLGDSLMSVGMLVVLDSIINRITKNRAQGKNTFIFIDEIYLLMRHQYSANFIHDLWKRVRKYGAFCTGITQNVGDMLQSQTARNMLSNSEFLVMLNQSTPDRDELTSLLGLSPNQLSHIIDAEVGHGLLKVGSSIVPFSNKFPKETELYRLITTKIDEVER